MRFTLGLALSLGVISPVWANDTLPELAPVDETGSDPSFAAFKTELLRVVGEKDVKALTAMIAPDIKADFGGGEGRDYFFDAWGLNTAPGESALWAELETVLTLGATREEDGGFVAPYVFSRWPDEVDAFEYVAVTGMTDFLADPCKPDSIAASLGPVLLRVLMDEPPGAFVCDWAQSYRYVEVGPGRRGFVDANHVRSPIDYRARFESRDGHWRMVFFVAGD